MTIPPTGDSSSRPRPAALNAATATENLNPDPPTETSPDNVKPRSEFIQGVIGSLPLWLGIIPFGLAYSLAAKTAGLNPFEIQGMSLLVYAGAAQLIASGLFASGAPGLSIILVTLIVNLRHILFGTSLLTALAHLKWWQKVLLAYGLTDEAYAVSVRKLTQKQAGPAFLVGAIVSLYLCWQASTFLGLLLGGVIPDPTTLGLQLVFPLSFSVMLMPYLKLGPGQAAALAAGALAIAAKLLLGGNWYILIGAAGGTIVGFLVEKKSKL
ncbi:MAG: branched-chain amino acid permease [Chloroflexi bacterium]|jgi:4-azaleucine resistance transporter AzlC|nr:branched-chain amino acid permease [Chloroflexota bacterium]